MTDNVGQIDAGIAAHDQWKARLQAAIGAGASEFTPDQVRVDNLCLFGKWFYGAGADLVDSPHYQRVRELHVLFHASAAAILSMAIGGDQTQARIALGFGGEFAKASLQLKDELERWRAEMQQA